MSRGNPDSYMDYVMLGFVLCLFIPMFIAKFTIGLPFYILGKLADQHDDVMNKLLD